MTIQSTQFVVTQAMLDEHNIQALVELEYMKVGNDVMSDALSKLENALTLTQQSLDALTTLQNLHNQIQVSAPGSMNFTYSAGTQTLTLTYTGDGSLTTTIVGSSSVSDPINGGATSGTFVVSSTLTSGQTYTFVVDSKNSYISGYQLLASNYYGQPIPVQFSVNLPATATQPAIRGVITSSAQPEYANFVSRLTDSKTQIGDLIHQLSAITNPTDSTTLLAKLRTVYDQMPDSNASFSSINNWLVDNYNSTTGSTIVNRGNIQQAITNAITAGESTNTSQNEAVRRYMFVFEQYCQSAAAILNTLNQLFQKITRGISG